MQRNSRAVPARCTGSVCDWESAGGGVVMGGQKEGRVRVEVPDGAGQRWRQWAHGMMCRQVL